MFAQNSPINYSNFHFWSLQPHFLYYKRYFLYLSRKISQIQYVSDKRINFFLCFYKNLGVLLIIYSSRFIDRNETYNNIFGIWEHLSNWIVNRILESVKTYKKFKKAVDFMYSNNKVYVSSFLFEAIKKFESTNSPNTFTWIVNNWKYSLRQVLKVLSALIIFALWIFSFAFPKRNTFS